MSESDTFSSNQNKSKRQVNDEMIQPYVNTLVEMVNYNRTKLLNDTTYKGLSEEKRLEHIQKHPDYQDFYRSFPGVTTYAISRGIYSTKVFKRYLKYKFTKDPTPAERAELVNNPEGQKLWANHFYAIYVKWLYAEKNPHCTQPELNQVYNDILNELNKETKRFFKTYEQEKAIFDKEKENLTREKKEELKDLFKKRLQKKVEQNDNN